MTKLNRRDALPPEVQPRGAPEDGPDVRLCGAVPDTTCASELPGCEKLKVGARTTFFFRAASWSAVAAQSLRGGRVRCDCGLPTLALCAGPRQ